MNQCRASILGFIVGIGSVDNERRNNLELSARSGCGERSLPVAVLIVDRGTAVEQGEHRVEFPVLYSKQERRLSEAVLLVCVAAPAQKSVDSWQRPGAYGSQQRCLPGLGFVVLVRAAVDEHSHSIDAAFTRCGNERRFAETVGTISCCAAFGEKHRQRAALAAFDCCEQRRAPFRRLDVRVGSGGEESHDDIRRVEHLRGIRKRCVPVAVEAINNGAGLREHFHERSFSGAHRGDERGLPNPILCIHNSPEPEHLTQRLHGLDLCYGKEERGDPGLSFEFKRLTAATSGSSEEKLEAAPALLLDGHQRWSHGILELDVHERRTRQESLEDHLLIAFDRGGQSCQPWKRLQMYLSTRADESAHSVNLAARGDINES
mmetsp:Transcript_31193/g.101706  ORF Transcript_31193/g.101706 Transcript_31193/m.101706 type:complete len:376 (-) Transcript_31193:3419-4546(-)